MAQKIPEADKDNAGGDEWKTLIGGVQEMTGAFMVLGLTNMDGTGAPQVMAGSRIEINGTKYKCQANENIGGTPANNQQNYIYAAAAGGGASFSYNTAPPQWDPAKGGWYSGNNRAVAKLFYAGGQYNGKALLDGHNAMDKINTRQPVPASGGFLIETGPVNGEKTFALQPGVYRFELKGGKGGKGGDKTDTNTGITYFGGNGAEGQAVTGTFRVTEGVNAALSTGGDGEDGGTPISTSSSAGGGGCTGGAAYFVLGNDVYVAIGGSGGGGAPNSGNSSGGGGGGGGFGAAADGDVFPGSPDRSGRGGRDGIGGNAGVGDVCGGGGSGFVRGGKGGVKYGGESDGYLSGYDGGGAGKPGGDSKLGPYPPKGLGSSGGASQIFTEEVFPFTRRCYNAFQGGGAGGNWGSSGDSKGGGGLKWASSGYARIYRMW